MVVHVRKHQSLLAEPERRLLSWVRRIAMLVVSFLGIASVASADVCLSIDQAYDTFTATDRNAALLLLGRAFESAGEHVVAPPCDEEYLVSHVQLGNTISIALSGPKGRREATAIGLDDIPAVYSQIVRSILTGKPNITDRSNVSEAQMVVRRVPSDSLFYVRLGYGAMFGGSAYGSPAFGFGYRHEVDTFAIDVSFLNVQFDDETDRYGSFGGTTASSGAWIRLEVLRFLNGISDRSPYFGGGFSIGGASVTNGGRSAEGNGLQGELTAGYEFARTSTIRVFVQADAQLPFYKLTTRTFNARDPSNGTRQYMPALSVSLGIGWQHGR